VEQTGDCRATQFLIQKISIDVQRGNAAAVIGLGRFCCSAHRMLMSFACDDFVIAVLTIFWLC